MNILKNNIDNILIYIIFSFRSVYLDEKRKEKLEAKGKNKKKKANKEGKVLKILLFIFKISLYI